MTSDSALWYFAYGANMNPAVFIERRGSVQVARDRGCLKGYRLVFDRPGIPLLEPAFANLESDPHSEVWGLLWRISAEALGRLDKQEGGGAYARLPVEVQGDEVGMVSAITYQAGRTLSGLRPSRRYLDVILNGARAAQLPEDYVSALSRTSAHDIPFGHVVSPIALRFFERCFVAGIDVKRLFDRYWDFVARRRSK